MSTVFNSEKAQQMDPRVLAVVSFLQRNILLFIGVISLILSLIHI